MRILNYGSLNLDYVYDVNAIVRAGETISSNDMNVFPGGKGLNQSIALAKAGARVFHAGLIGQDGKQLKEILDVNGVSTEHLSVCGKNNGHAMIQVDAVGQNSIVLYGGSNQENTKALVDSILEYFGADDILLVQNEVNCLAYMIEKACRRGMQIALNPSPFNELITACDLTKVSYFLLNEIEGCELTGKEQPAEILDEMRSRYPKAKIVLTLGKKGCWYADEDQRVFQPAFVVKAVDTTAAGDTFTGYFLAAVTEGMPVEEALLFATTASAIAVSRKGASSSIPGRQEVLDYNR